MKIIWSVSVAILLVAVNFLLGDVNFGPVGSFKFFCASALTVLLLAEYAFLFYFGFAREFGNFSSLNILRFSVILLIGCGFAGVGIFARIAENDFCVQPFELNWAGVFLVALLIGGVVFNSDLLKKRESNA